jgi:nucleoside-diphosphate-sugar epimerase
VRVLVTGGRGFLGGHVCDALRAAGHEAIPLGRVDGDLAKPGVAERLLDEHRPDAVVHLAAVMPDDARLAQNAPITALVAQACAERGVRLLHGSTTSVYGDETPYADSKRASEEAAGSATLLRFSFPYGPGQRRGAIPTMLRQALAREPIVVYRGWRRSFCFAGDAARAVVLLLEQEADGAWDIGRDDDARTLAAVAELACGLTDAPARLIEVVDPPAGPVSVLEHLDLEPLRRIGWWPEVELVDGMKRTLDWLLSPPA